MSKAVLQSRYLCLFFSGTKAEPFNSQNTVVGNFETFTVHLNVTSSPTKRYLIPPLILTWGGTARADDDCDGNMVPLMQAGV